MPCRSRASHQYRSTRRHRAGFTRLSAFACAASAPCASTCWSGSETDPHPRVLACATRRRRTPRRIRGRWRIYRCAGHDVSRRVFRSTSFSSILKSLGFSAQKRKAPEKPKPDAEPVTDIATDAPSDQHPRHLLKRPQPTRLDRSRQPRQPARPHLKPLQKPNRLTLLRLCLLTLHEPRPPHLTPRRQTPQHRQNLK